MKKLIILPIETYAREIDHKTLLGVYLAKTLRVPVVLAASNIANKLAIELGENAIYIGKNFFSVKTFLSTTPLIDNSVLVKMLDKGVDVLFCHEEGGLFLNGDSSQLDIEQFQLNLPLYGCSLPANHEKLAMFHWGEYQANMAQECLPNIKHYAAGAHFIDAAKLYQQWEGKLKQFISKESRADISITANTAFLSNGIYTSPYLLSLSSEISNTSDWANQVDTETSVLLLTKELRDLGKDICFRPHPGSGGTHMKDWLEYCQTIGIKVSNPTYESALSYLLSSRINIHPGCSTSFQSLFLKKPTIRFTNSYSRFSKDLITETVVEQREDIIPSLKYPSVPVLGRLAASLLANLAPDKIDSFTRLKDHLNSSRYAARRLSRVDISLIRSFLQAEDIRMSLRYLKQSVSKSTSMSSKYRGLRKRDIYRNMLLGEMTWNNYPEVSAHANRHSVFFLPGRYSKHQ